MPRPITLSADPAVWFQASTPAAPRRARIDPAKLPEALSCTFCGSNAGKPQRQADGAIACPLCELPLHLERPRIDEEAALIWLPEMTQLTVNALMREVHMGLRTFGEDVQAGASFKSKSSDLRAFHATRAVLSERMATAANHLGTALPAELGQALIEMAPSAYAERTKLLGGLRLLPLGRFFDGDEDVYPEIVDRWIAVSKGQAANPQPGP